MELGTSCFQSDLDFCPECGTILPLPGVQDKVTCVRCSFSIDVRDFEGKVVQSCVEFNRLGSVALMIMDDGQEVKGPMQEVRSSSPCTDFEGKVVQSCVEFNRLGSVALMIMDDGQEVKGPMIDRKCPQCGHEGMVYHTRQMRSADEGQTVFYTCGQCKSRRINPAKPSEVFLHGSSVTGRGLIPHSRSTPPPHGPQENRSLTIKLRKRKPDKKVEWSSDTVDNEHLGRRSSKCE
ncbi:DNA-directed RNA polymerase I subunit RPA12 [Chelonia mydas]|uniref:DNA-directed RNA polymerase I subunit RPA12 n=1 Tax=Chelonia mydas TaxID=8469 RepID=M7ARN8_CHEMY|nr:DNA-directed RNA polymerase I subunit RPA12 [Chelonia mydas]